MSDQDTHPESAKDKAQICTLKWFNTAKGFGFVVPENTTYDVFLHASILQGGGHPLIGKGAILSCHIDQSDNGYFVRDVIEVLQAGESLFAKEVEDATSEKQHALRGIVKWYDPLKEFGFIMPDDGVKDIFVHKSCLKESGLEDLTPGQSVIVEYKPVLKGREAISVKVIENP